MDRSHKLETVVNIAFPIKKKRLRHISVPLPLAFPPFLFSAGSQPMKWYLT